MFKSVYLEELPFVRLEICPRSLAAAAAPEAVEGKRYLANNMLHDDSAQPDVERLNHKLNNCLVCRCV